jgi:hypothetical protein
MTRTFIVSLLLVLAGCSGLPSRQDTSSPCQVSEASSACQVERYLEASGQ